MGLGRKTQSAVAVAAALALCLTAIVLPATAGAAVERTVAVTAAATVKVPNDLATLGLGVKRDRKTRAAALRATASGLRKVISAAKEISGVGEGDVRTGRIDVRPLKRGTVTIYRATEGAKITLHEPSKAGELVAKALGAGASGVSGPFFSVGDEEEAFAKVLAVAFDKAKERATILADQAGAKLGRVIVIEEGNGRISTPGGEFNGSFFGEEAATPVEAKTPKPPTKPGTSTVKATVHVVFELL